MISVKNTKTLPGQIITIKTCDYGKKKKSANI
jgi:hypothetical protein